MERDPIEMLLDENCTDPITLYGKNGEPMTFDQIALIPMEDRGVYVILKPQEDDTLAEDEALVFEIMEDKDGCYLEVTEDDETLDAVFEEYDALLSAEGIS